MSASAVPPLPLAEVTRRAIEVLARELGPADAARFINQFSVGSGTTPPSGRLFGHLTLAEIVADIRRSAAPDQPPPAATQAGPAMTRGGPHATNLACLDAAALIGADDKQKPPFATGDLDRGETVRMRFPDGGRATVKLRDIWETRDSPATPPAART